MDSFPCNTFLLIAFKCSYHIRLWIVNGFTLIKPCVGKRVIFVADANTASHTTLLHLKENVMKPWNVLVRKSHLLSKSSYPGKTQPLSLFSYLQLYLWMWIPWSFVVSVNTMFSPSSDIFTFLFWFSVLSQATSY